MNKKIYQDTWPLMPIVEEFMAFKEMCSYTEKQFKDMCMGTWDPLCDPEYTCEIIDRIFHPHINLKAHYQTNKKLLSGRKTIKRYEKNKRRSARI